jgi:hypothetical protein
MAELMALATIVLVGIILILSLHKFNELNAEVSIFKWVSLKIASKGGRIDSDSELSDTDIGALIQRYNEDFSRAVVTRDLRYMGATTTPNGLIQAQQNISNVITSNQAYGCTSVYLVGYKLVVSRLTPVNKSL